jgi:uncharacterized protein YjiS (DUF1127 family)
MLAAAFPRSSWRAESDAVYASALVDAGLSTDDIAAVVRQAVATVDELPTVARLLAVWREQRRALTELVRCPRCGSDHVIVERGEFVDCMECSP